MRAAVLAVAAAALCAGAWAAADAQKPLHGRTVRFRHPVRALGADGPGAAVLLGKKTDCHVAAWDAHQRRPTTIQRYCLGSNRDSSYGIARARSRVAWVETAGGNLLEEHLLVASPAHKKPLDLVFAESGPDPGGDYVGRVRGAGRFLVFELYRRCVPSEPGEPPNGCPSYGAVDRGQVWVYDPKARPGLCPDSDARVRRCRLLASAQGRVSLLAAARPGLVAVEAAPGEVAVVGVDGKLLGDVSVPAGAAHVAFSDSSLLVQRGRALDLYRLRGGSVSRTLHVPAGKLVDGSDGLALLLHGRSIVLVRLRDVQLARLRVPGKGAVHAALEPQGLFYSYGAHVRFLPRRRLDALLRGA